MKELIGKIVSQLWINDEESVLLFMHPDGGWTAYETEGDCCSETWFADINGVSVLIGATVVSAVDVEMDNVDDGRTRQEEDEFYGVKLTTDKGFVDIVYRNSSNGYYGGNIKLSKGGQDTSQFRQILDDWSA